MKPDVEPLEAGAVQKRKKLVLLDILEILQKHTDADHTLTVAEIGKLLEEEYDLIIERKAIKKNLLDLLACGYEIGCRETVRGSGKSQKRVLTDWYILRDFTDAELRLIVDSLLFSKHIPGKQCRALIEKVERLSSKYFANKMKHVRTMPVERPQNPELFLTIEVLDEAIGRGRQVEFEYCEYATDKQLHPKKDAKGKVKHYLVNPYQMVATNGRYYLIANYHYYDSIGHYRVDRIKNIRLLEDSPARPASKIPGMENGLDLPVHMAEHIYMFSGDKGTVTMRLNKRILGDVLDWFGKDIRFFDETEDEVSASVVVNYQSMKYWAMQYACFVTVTSPLSLAEEIGRDLAAAASKYGH